MFLSPKTPHRAYPDGPPAISASPRTKDKTRPLGQSRVGVGVGTSMADPINVLAYGLGA